MKTIDQLEEDIRIFILGLYYSSWSKALTDDMKGRKLYITHIQGQYGNGAGYMFVIEGTPPRGMVYYFPEFNEIWFRKGNGSWKDLTIAQKHIDIRVVLKQWKEIKEKK